MDKCHWCNKIACGFLNLSSGAASVPANMVPACEDHMPKIATFQVIKPIPIPECGHGEGLPADSPVVINA